MEGAVGNAEKSPRLRVMSVLAITLQKGERSDKIALLQEVASVWQPQLLLLYSNGERNRDVKRLESCVREE